MSETTEPKMNVYQCIASVQYALAKAGISKDRKNEQQHYSFRGIDDVYNALSTVLASVGLVIIPSYTERTITEREAKSGNIMFCVVVKGDYTLISMHDGSSVAAGPFWGEAMDTGDKATNKAMSASYKYMAMQVFAIPTEGDNDADKTTQPETAKITARGGARELTSQARREEIDRLAGRVIDAFLKKDPDLAYANYLDGRVAFKGDADAYTAFWDCFDSKQRRTLLDMKEAAAKDPATQG